MYPCACLSWRGRVIGRGRLLPPFTHADSYTMTEAERPVVGSRDPAGFTIVDVAAWGSLAHMISAGEILGQHAKGFF